MGPLLCHAFVWGCRWSSNMEVGLDDVRGDRRGHLPAELRGLLDRDRDGDLRVYHGCERDEPCGVEAVDAGLRGAGLARHLDAEPREVGRRTGTLVDHV